MFNQIKNKMEKEKKDLNVKQTLTEFYDSLPRLEAPKTKFVSDIANMCDVRETTVRNWVKGKVKPSDPNHVKILEKVTGIDSKSLFAK